MNALAFALPAALEATSPPETRGVPRDQVGLLVADGRDGSITHERFGRLPEILGGGLGEADNAGPCSGIACLTSIAVETRVGRYVDHTAILLLTKVRHAAVRSRGATNAAAIRIRA